MVKEDFLTKNISGFTTALESVVLYDRMAQAKGLLQSLDPRVKILTFVLFIIAIGLVKSLWLLGAALLFIIGLTFASKVPLGFFIKRVFLFIPLFTLVIALPALFTTPGQVWVHVFGHVTITQQGARSAALLVLRASDSLCFGSLLILTTPWNNLLVALRSLKMPSLIVAILGMTYRYIFVLLHTVNSMFLARRSRSLQTFSSAENRQWLTRILAVTLAKSQHLSEEVYQAMLSKGYQGEIYTLDSLTVRAIDFAWIAGAISLTTLLLWVTYR